MASARRTRDQTAGGQTAGDQRTGDLHPACRAVALTCIDYRVVEPLRRALDERGLIGGTDLVAWPGGALQLALGDPTAVEEAVRLAADLHRPDEIVLVAHHDCGWLGGSERFDSPGAEQTFLDEALTTAARRIERLADGVRITRLRLEPDRVVAP